MDILGIGCCAVDDVLYVKRYPSADSKAEVIRRERRCGGLTAIALITAAQLGCTCKFAGTLGDDDLSRYVMDAMNEQGVNTSTTVRQSDARPVYSNIIVDETTKSRTIFYDPRNVLGAHESQPPADLIRSARVLYIDHYGTAGQIRACRIARDAKIPIVADFEDEHAPRFAELLDLVDHLILSRDFACRLTGAQDPAAAARLLWHARRSAVVVTAGKEGCWSIDATVDRPTHTPPFNVTVLDTTGCGDVFHGAYAAGLARNLPLPKRLRLAAAAAAIKASTTGHASAIADSWKWI